MRVSSSPCFRFFVTSIQSPMVRRLAVLVLLAPVCAASAQKPEAAKAPQAAPLPDTLVFINGDQLSGTLIRSAGPGVLFRSNMVGEVQVPWARIKELKTNGNMVIIREDVLTHKNNRDLKLPSGPITVADQSVTQKRETGESLPPVPLKSVKFIVDENVFQRQITGSPSLFAGWNGTLTAGATLVQATQDQTTFTGSVNLVRLVPTVSWLTPRNRTRIGFTGAFGKITQPSFKVNGVTYPENSAKTSIFRAEAERDQSLTPRFYLLAKTVFDHNYSQSLDLQQRYGAGIGWIAFKTPVHSLSFDAMLQYEAQSFLNTTVSADQKLIGSTLDGTWGAILPHGIQATQIVYWIPAFNNPHAYSVGESNSVTLPFYKGLAFSITSIDDYLNNPPTSIPPTKRNSFEFTTGISFTIKSKY